MGKRSKVTVVIPNYNGMKYIGKCLDSLLGGSLVPEIIVVDNASTDGSFEMIRDEYPSVLLLRLRKNTGFCHAVNSGIRLSRTPYVMLLNNDAAVDSECVKELYECIHTHRRTFSVQARILSMKDPDVIDDAGDFYCALGWAFARGKMQNRDSFTEVTEIFSACACAAIYRRAVFESIGYFDERHFCYLEDVDIGWRAGIYGWRNLYCPSAVAYHAGSASSGSVHNEFKEIMTAGNSRYLVYKNMPAVFRVLNAPLFFAGERIKLFYFRRKGLGDAWLQGMARGTALIDRAGYEDRMRSLESPEKGTIEEEACLLKETEDGPIVHPLYLGGKVKFRLVHLPNYLRIQAKLIAYTGKRMLSK